jgi:NADPH-dependent ferric siderophore reductase
LARGNRHRQVNEARHARQLRTARVLRTEFVTPHMIRVWFGGEDLACLGVGEFADAYVKLVFPPPGASYRTPFDVDEIQRNLTPDQWPVMRSFTVRWWDSNASELSIDFVYHGDEGAAGPWAAQARPGDEIQFRGPGGAYSPGPDADWHLLVGDESALPAIAAALERIPRGVPARVFIELDDPSDKQVLTSPGDLEVVWVSHSFSDPEPGGILLDAIARAELPAGRLQAFVHGEAGMVKQLRRYLRFEMQIPSDALSISGYWRRGRTDERWRAEKADWNREVESEEKQYALSQRSDPLPGP